MDEETFERQMRDMKEKLDAERNSAVHLRIAAVEAQARSVIDAQALVNKNLSDQMGSLKTSTEKGFNDIRIGIIVLGIGVVLTLTANLPGLLAVLKGKGL